MQTQRRQRISSAYGESIAGRPEVHDGLRKCGRSSTMRICLLTVAALFVTASAPHAQELPCSVLPRRLGGFPAIQQCEKFSECHSRGAPDLLPFECEVGNLDLIRLASHFTRLRL